MQSYSVCEMLTTSNLQICVSEHTFFIIFNVFFLKKICVISRVFYWYLPYCHLYMKCYALWVLLNYYKLLLLGLLSSTFEIFFISIITVRVLFMLVLIVSIFCLLFSISTLRLAFSSCYFCYLVFFSIENTILFSLVSLCGVYSY